MASRVSKSIPGPEASAAPAPSGNREEQLLAISRRLFARQGFKSTSMRDIAQEAGITKAALYYYFPNKDEIYERVVIDSLEALVQTIGAEVARAASPTGRVRAFMRASADFLDRERDAWLAASHAFRESGHTERRGIALHLRDSYEKLLRRCVVEGIAAGEFRPVDAAMATRLLLSGLNHVTRWHSPQGKLSVRDVVDQYLDMILVGLEVHNAAAAAMPDPVNESRKAAKTRAARV